MGEDTNQTQITETNGEPIVAVETENGGYATNPGQENEQWYENLEGIQQDLNYRIDLQNLPD